MSDANRTLVSVTPETTFGTTPANPVFENLHIKSAGLQVAPKFVQSQELRADRQVPAMVRVGTEAGGQLGLEWSYGSIDTLLSAALANSWVGRNDFTNSTVGQNVASSTSTTTLTLAGAAAAATWTAGMLVQLFNSGGQDGVYQVASVAGGVLTLNAATPVATQASFAIGTRIKHVGYFYAAGVASATATGLSLSSGSFTGQVTVGEWIKIGGSNPLNQFSGNSGGNNGFARITAVNGATVTLDNRPSSWAVDAGAGQVIYVITADRCVNGVTPQSFTVEEQFQDLATPEFHYYYGMRVGTFGLQLNTQALVEAAVTFVGQSGLSTPATVRVTGATDKVTTANPFNTSTHLLRQWLGGAALGNGNFVMGATIQIENGLRRNPALGTDKSQDVKYGRCVVTGTLNTYYGDKSLLTLLRNNTATALTFVLYNALGQAFVVDIPNVILSSGDPTVSGIDTDRMLQLNFQAIYDQFATTIRVSRFDSVATPAS